MPTKAFTQLHKRLEDIDRLLEAHRSLSQFRQIRAATTSGQNDIARALSIAQRAFAGPLRGRRWGMEALNRAGVVLLSAHLEGYVEDLFEEAANAIAVSVFDTQFYDTHSFVEQAVTRFHNPSPKNMKELFAKLGIRDVMDGIEWGGTPNVKIRTHLGQFVSLRNKIAHGEQPSVTRSELKHEVTFVRHFAKQLEKRLYGYLRDMADVRLW